MPVWNVSRVSRRATLAVAAVTLMLALAACNAAPGGGGGSSPSSANGTAAATDDATGEASTPQPTGSVSPEPSEDGDAVIPGLTAAEVATLLEGAGLTCEDNAVATRVEYECEKVADDFRNTVVVRGASPEEITHVSVAALGFGGDFVAREFLPLVAALPCDGCDPAAASEWVTEKYDAGGEGTVGPLRLALSGDASEKVLEITASE